MNIIRGKLKRAQKIVIYGPEGIGKSTFASMFPKTLFIDTEGSTAQLNVARTESPSSWTMLLSQVEYVKNNPDICKTLVIDTADWAEKLTIQHICNKYKVDGIEGLGYGKGYTYLEEEFGRFLNKLSDLIEIGINVVFTAHSKITRFDQPDEIGSYDRWELKLQKKTSPLLKEWADMVLFANYKTSVVNVDNQGAAKGKNKAQGGKRVMYTQHTPSWDAKNRHELEKELDFKYENIEHILHSVENKKVDNKSEKQLNNYKYFKHKLIGNVFKERDTDPKLLDLEMLEEITRSDYEEIINKDKTLDDPMENERIEIVNIKEKNNGFTWKQAFNEFCSKTIDIEKTLDDATELSKEETRNMEQEFSKKKKEVYVRNKELRDLMAMQNVSVEEIQVVVAQQGYYPLDTDINNYDEGFTKGVLVGAWNQVLKMILEERGN